MVDAVGERTGRTSDIRPVGAQSGGQVVGLRLQTPTQTIGPVQHQIAAAYTGRDIRWRRRGTDHAQHAGEGIERVGQPAPRRTTYRGEIAGVSGRAEQLELVARRERAAGID